MREILGTAATGFVMGYVLSASRFTSWDEVHRMFTFASWRLTLGFGLAVVLLGLGFAVIQRLQRPDWPTRPMHPGIIVGGVMFGVGWALCGACPSIAWVQLGEGSAGALVTLAGMFLGNWLYSVVHQRWLRWTTGSCTGD